MNPKRTRQAASLLAAALFVTAPAFSFDLPLSSESVREAYFLGQRHDGSSGRLLENYMKHLPPPKSGPYISSVTFFTPFAQLVQFCDRYIGNYSAQQARLDHLNQEESVKITVEIYLTNSYGALIANPTASRSSSSPALIPRPYDFWRDFRVQVYDGNKIVSPSASGGHGLYRCGRYGPCRPMGAAIDLEFPANAFTSDSVTVQVIPPEGDSVSVDFDLTRLR
jgi:hypothetical protein